MSSTKQDTFRFDRGEQIEDELEVFDDDEPAVRVAGLKKHFPIYDGILRRQTDRVRAVDGVSFSIPAGETFGLVGESGSGKTTVGRTLLRITEPTAGSIEIHGQDIRSLEGSELRKFRRNMQMVFQDPDSSLNPRQSVKQIIESPMKIHNVGDPGERTERVEELLEMVDLPRETMYKYPNALSGGQKQRVGIARAVALNPKLVVLDEPTSALDVSVQAHVVEILEDIQDRFDLTYLFISHDLSLVKNVSDRMGVMYLGRLVEAGEVDAVYRNPQHPYTKSLLSSIPTVTEADVSFKPPELYPEGEVPDPRDKPSGCSFRSRCQFEFDPCAEEEPRMYRTESGHCSKCYLHDDQYGSEAGR